MSIAIERLRELFDLDADSGTLRWRISTRRVKAGTVAGGLSGRGYLYVGADGHKLKVHRVVFAMAHGYWPESVDHINGIKTDNRLANLRAANHAENMQNSRLRSDNTSGFKGVTWDQCAGKWQARVRVNGRCKFLGYFDKVEVAAAKASAYREQHHKEFARHV